MAITSKDFIEIRMMKKFYPVALAYGTLVHNHSLRPGAHSTPAAEPENNELSHVKGKYGELAFLKFLMSEGVLPSHTPFRNDYTKKIVEDDFMVNAIQVEVKTKRRKDSSPWPPLLKYNVNLGKAGLDDSLYAFIEICPKGTFEEGPHCLLVGWADSAHIQKVGKRLEPGMKSDNGNFTFRRYDWDIHIDDLLEPAGFLERLQSVRDGLVSVAT